MSVDVLHVEFNGKRQPLKSISADIKPNIFTAKEAMEIVTKYVVITNARDEADCRGPVSACDSGPMTLPDGRISKDKIRERSSTIGMNNELKRLSTFENFWPEDCPVHRSYLARAGFYYTGARDAVKCFSCGGQVEGWECGDTAMGEHKRLFPTCNFANGRTTTNESLLEINERPEYERKLSSKIEQSQREIERRAKEKEAMIERVDPSETKKDFVSSAASSSNSLVKDEQMEAEDEGSSMLFGKYNQEHVRLQSFRNWPRTSPIEPRDLAKAGFYYLNQDDSVQCFACFGQISRWKPCDVPAVEHKTHFPNCPFVQGLDVGNEPISTPPVMHVGMPPPLRSLSTPAPTPAQLRAGQVMQQQRSLRAQLGPLNNCKHPNYVQENARLGTFRLWPGNPGLNVTPRILAKAGFYFTGLADECKCFYCDGGLKNWEPTDEPWTEHGKWFPRCEWLIQQRGQAFISHVQKFNPPPVSTPGTKTSTRGRSEQDYGGTGRSGHHYNEPLQFTPPLFAPEEPYSQPPHRFEPTYQERQPQASSSKLSATPIRSKKEMTIEEEKAAALQEFNYKSRPSEPEAAAEVNFRPKLKKLDASEQCAPKSKLEDEQSNATSSIHDFMQSPTVDMAVQMGYHHDLIRYVVTKHFKKTGREFSSPDELLDSIWEAQGQGVESTLGEGGKAAGGQDLEYLRKPPKDFDSESASAISSSIVDIQAEKLAGLSIHDEPRPRISSSSRNAALVTPIGSLRPQISVTSGSSDQSYQDKQLCKICLDNELSTVFLPCKHLATCSDCAARVTECPMCRQPIIDSLTIYMP